MNITGTWKGEYVFEETKDGGERKVLGTVVPFTMVLKQGWLGTFSGTVQDDPRTGFAEEGAIKGRIKGNVISFEKLMPVMRFLHEPNRMTLEQFADRYKLVIDTHVPHPKIRHIGDMSADGNSVEGTWLAPEERMPVPGSAATVQLPILAGSWKMTRQTP
jgi:hypothetical protein